MAAYREGDRVKVTTTVHSSSGSGYAGDRGHIEAISEAWGQDVYQVGLDNGVRLERVRESDLTRD
jgi:hypothetical protein